PVHAPCTATTPLMVPTSASGPDSDGDAKWGSGEPSPIWCRTWPVPGSSWYSTPEFQSGTQTALPPSTGEPCAGPGPRQSTRIALPAVSTAAIPPEVQGTYTTVPLVAIPPKAAHARALATCEPTPVRWREFSRYALPFLPSAKIIPLPSRPGEVEPRSRSEALSAAQVAGAKIPVRRRAGVSAVTESLPS